MERDYSELEGLEVDVNAYEKIYRGRIVGCDPDIGITVVSVEDPKHYLCCLIGPSAPGFKNRVGTSEQNKLFFNKIVEMIRNGCINVNESGDVYKEIFHVDANAMGIKPSVETCAFSQ